MGRENKKRKGVPFTESVDNLVWVIRKRTMEMTDMADKCPICQGSPLGNSRSLPCEFCNGSGYCKSNTVLPTS